MYIQFKEHGCKCSALFAFWNEYMEMVWLLLNFIHGDRDANWLLHLETFRAMLPYDRAFDHLNYFRWGTVYLTDMKMLQEVAPTVHREFTENRAHAVSTSSFVSSFNSVSCTRHGIRADSEQRFQNQRRDCWSYWHGGHKG